LPFPTASLTWSEARIATKNLVFAAGKAQLKKLRSTEAQPLLDGSIAPNRGQQRRERGLEPPVLLGPARPPLGLLPDSPIIYRSQPKVPRDDAHRGLAAS
jgi:hypothetical protein